MTREQANRGVINAAGGASPITGDGPVFLQVDRDELVAPFAGTLHPEDAPVVAEQLTRMRSHPSDPVLVRWLEPTGDTRYVELVFSVARDGGVAGGRPVVHGWEVTSLIRRQQALEHLALHDPLTGLANRLLFEERVRDELRRRHRTGLDVAVIYGDLDGFKDVNDTWGHAAGDILLTTLADRLRDSVRPGDVVARLGGDEFAICCPDLSGPDDALLVANRMVDDVTGPVPLGSALVRVSVAVGVALAAPDEPSDGAQLIGRADLAMYAAKGSGHSRVSLAPTADETREVS